MQSLTLCLFRLLLLSIAPLCFATSVKGELTRSPVRPFLTKPLTTWSEQKRLQDQMTGRTIERNLAHWKPTPENHATPPAKLRYIASDISGVWMHGSGEEYTKIKLSAIAMRPGTYRVIWEAVGETYSFLLERTATYRGGVLMLDRPVEEYISSPYKRLFTIKTPQGIRLISDVKLFYCQKDHLVLPRPFDSFMKTTDIKAVMK